MKISWFRTASAIDSRFLSCFLSRCVVGVGEREMVAGFRSGNIIITKSQSLYTEAQSLIPIAYSFSFFPFLFKNSAGNDQKHQHVALRI